MSWTTSDKEREEIINLIERKRVEMTDKKDIIAFFHRAGFCDENGKAKYPYTTSSRDKK